MKVVRIFCVKVVQDLLGQIGGLSFHFFLKKESLDWLKARSLCALHKSLLFV
jgi:hypothetical protein